MRVCIKRLCASICFLFLYALQSGAQLIDGTSSFKKIDSQSYFRAHYDNDFFANRDYYYTQGITLEYAHKKLGHFPVYKVLVKANDNIQYGIRYNLFGYTPTSIASDSILYDDRPFEGSMSLSFFSVSTNLKKKLHIASSFSIGVIGPAALGKEIQDFIHRQTGNAKPKGWQFQIKNDIILNYQLNIEKNFFSTNGFTINGTSELRLGTLHDHLSAGLNFMAGHFNDTYTGGKKKTSFYIYGQARGNLIAYDATMQGGLFNRNSPYKISSGNVTRTTFQADGGLILKTGKLYFGYSRSFLTKEFKTGKEHQWGGLTFGLIW